MSRERANADDVESDAAKYDLANRLKLALALPVYELLSAAISIASERRQPLYLVGGPVRDMLLHRPITDLDLVVEHDAWPVAEAFCAMHSGNITKHEAFRTAVVTVPLHDSSFAIDFVTARRESYPAAASLPVVTPSHIADDLFRRDFTVNTLALRLNTLDTVALIDLYHGRADLHAGMIRVLHSASFHDDPTRILRAARFAARLGFTVESATRSLIAAALNDQMIACTSPQRILNELWLVLDEPRPESALALLHEWDGFPQLALAWSNDWPTHLAAARAATWTDVALRDLYLGLMLWPLDSQQRKAFAARYNLPVPAQKLLHELARIPLADLAQPDMSPVTLEQRLHSFSITALRVAQLVAAPVAASNIGRYIDSIRPLPPLLSGDDLRAAGVAPGPIYRTLLDELRRAQLDGDVTTPEQAREWIANRIG